MNSEPMLLATPSRDGLELRPEGPWIAANVSRLEALSLAARAAVDRSKAVTLDLAGISELDTLGAWLLEKLSRRAASSSRSVHVVGIADNFAGLMDEVRQVNRHNPLPTPTPNRVLHRLHDLGKSTVDAREDIRIFLQMLGALFMSLAGVLRRPRSLRLTSLVYQRPRSNLEPSKTSMLPQLHYGITAKVLHWTIVALLVVQYPIGWLMPDIHRGMQPGVGMTLHVSIGLVLLILIVLRFAWRLTHPVVPESSSPAWQRRTSEGVHWMLYLMVLLTTVTGWLFASFRGWSISFFYLFPFPMLFTNNPTAGKAIDGLHQAAEWFLLVLVGIHVAAALVHVLYYRDRVMARMLPR